MLMATMDIRWSVLVYFQIEIILLTSFGVCAETSADRLDYSRITVSTDAVDGTSGLADNALVTSHETTFEDELTSAYSTVVMATSATDVQSSVDSVGKSTVVDAKSLETGDPLTSGQRSTADVLTTISGSELTTAITSTDQPEPQLIGSFPPDQSSPATDAASTGAPTEGMTTTRPGVSSVRPSSTPASTHRSEPEVTSRVAVHDDVTSVSTAAARFSTSPAASTAETTTMTTRTSPVTSDVVTTSTVTSPVVKLDDVTSVRSSTVSTAFRSSVVSRTTSVVTNRTSGLGAMSTAGYSDSSSQTAVSAETSSGMTTAAAVPAITEWWLSVAWLAGAAAAGVVIVIIIILLVIIIARRVGHSRGRNSFASERSFRYNDIIVDAPAGKYKRSKRGNESVELDGVAISTIRRNAPPSARADIVDNIFVGTFPDRRLDDWTDGPGPSQQNHDTNNLYGHDSDADSANEKGLTTFCARNSTYRGKPATDS